MEAGGKVHTTERVAGFLVTMYGSWKEVVRALALYTYIYCISMAVRNIFEQKNTDSDLLTYFKMGIIF